MRINIIAKGDRLFKQAGDLGVEIEIFGAEKLYYLRQLSRIDKGEKVGKKITDAHRINCGCLDCIKHRENKQ